ncbi:uncharacterized protein DEA37_0012072 [Paragonimus westermani]|uniref:Nucleolar protein 14 n=1 Tax=Paragonimus westermani TaxID=34504 RepID=A0A5J4NHF6_9TREM|nr:uncharacterized protein DEA37_0012072 [Paragonimus westermani]
MKTSGKIKVKNVNRMVKTPRDSVLSKKLDRLGKVGGVKDLRLGSKDRHRSEAEKSLRRHIVERMLLADVVDEEFFVSGSDPHNFKEALAEKIAASKLLKLKRVEENEEQRERLKTVNSEWSQKIRFILSQISLKPPTTPKKAVRNRESVSKLLGELSSNKKVLPADLKNNINTEDKQVQKLHAVLENSLVAHRVVHLARCQRFSETKHLPTILVKGCLLRLLLRMKEHQSHAIVFMTQNIEQGQLRDLKDVIHQLLLTQLLLDYCQPRTNRNEESPALQSVQTMNNGAFFPEIVKLITRMWCLTNSTDETSTNSKPLILQKNLEDLHRSAYDRLKLEWVDEDFHVSPEELSSIQVACLHKLVNLSTQVCRLYSNLFVGCVCAQLFARMYSILSSVDTTKYPDELKTHLHELTDLLTSIWRSPTPKPLVSNARLRILSSETTERPVDQKVLKKLGLLPQLEPRFEERLCVRNDKNTASKRLLQRKVAREKRGAMREIRRDSQFLAMHQLKLTKASDAARKKKTQAILNSLRTIED